MQPTLRVQQPARPLLAIGLIVLSSYLAISLLSYSATDPSWNFSTSDPSKVGNLGGIVGSWVADGLLQILGLVSYLLTAIAFMSGFQRLKSRAILLSETPRTPKKRLWQLATGILLFVFCLAGILAMIPVKIYLSISLGGVLGHFIERAAVFCFSTLGAIILFTGGLWASIVLLTDKVLFLPENISLNFLTRARDKIRERLSSFRLTSFVKSRQPEVHHQPGAKLDLSSKLEGLFKRKETPVEESSELPVFDMKKKEIIQPIAQTESKTPLLPWISKPEVAESSSDRVLLMKEAPRPKKSKAKMNSKFELPSLQLLDMPQERGFEISKDELIANSRALEQKLLDFGVQGHVTNIRPGPIITLYEFEPAPGVKVKNIVNLTDDLKLAMKAVSIRIIAPIPGRAAVGIEIPNPRRQTVFLREILQSPFFQNSPSPIVMGMGKTTSGEPYVADLAKMPHLLIAGATGSGKSVGLNAMVVSMLFKASPDELKFIMIDPKMLELSVYEGIPHLMLPVVTDPKKAARALAWATKEMERRYKLISSLGARNLKSYNEKVERLTEDELKKELQIAKQTEAETSALINTEEDEKQEQQELALQEAGLDHYVKLPNIVVVIDELADLIMVAARDVEESIARLAQMARAAGIHLIIATQRPSVDVITGVIKANLPTRCAFQVASKVDSRTIIDGSGAENLIGDGDMLFLPPGTSRLERLHGPFISEDEISRVVRHLKAQADPDYTSVNINLEEAPPSEHGEMSDEIDDALYDQALSVVFETKSPSASMLQRRLRIGYNRAARLVERMEREGVVSAPQSGGKGREILVTPSYDS